VVGGHRTLNGITIIALPERRLVDPGA